MKKIIKYFFVTIISIVAILQMTTHNKKVSAATVGDVEYLKRADNGFYSIQKWTGSNWTYIIHSITNYTDKNGVKRVAYCINPDLNGIGYIPGEYEGYNVKIKELLSDQRLWRVYTNGYPYKTPQSMGLENEQDAYLATKQAAYCIIRGYSVNDVKKLYRAGLDPVEGQKLEDIKRRGEKIINAMCRLVDIGYNGKDTMKTNNLLTVQKVGEFLQDENDPKFYSQSYRVSSVVECSEYKVENVENLPEGTYVANSKGQKQVTFKGDETFKIMIPKEIITNNIDGKINVSGKCKNYPIFYAECQTGDYQNYVLCCDEYSNDIKAQGSMKVNAYTSKLIIEKTDKDTKKAIKGVKFSIFYENGEKIGTYETNEKGIINIQNLRQGTIKIKEDETNEEYVLNPEEIKVNLEYNSSKTVKLENELKKGIIKVIKVDGNNTKIRIPGVKFQIINENKEVVANLTTDENGEAQTKELPTTSKYTIKEIETAKEYELSNDEITVELKQNEIKTLTFKNIKKGPKEEDKKEEKKEIKKETLPRTGAINLENYFLGASFICGLIKKFF